MNRKTFVFGIGGTGARVIRALTMLLASGVKLEHSGGIIPIIVDVDTENEDTNRTIKALDLYKKIRSCAYGENLNNCEGFFGSSLTTLASQKASDGTAVKDEFQLKFAGISSTFAKYLKFDELDPIDEEFLKLLYDAAPREDPAAELNLELTKGFKGNPNIGCIVFNELQNTPEFKYFQNAIGEDDRIFIISSIFGGTGSAGFPQLLKLIKNSKNNRLKTAKIGAITIMPYFSVQDDKQSAIDSNRFISKAKAALSYYEKEMDELNCMYYIYDKPGAPYENHEGGKLQKNNAHVVEMISACSVIHFTNKSDFDNKTEFYEFGIKKDDPELSIRHFCETTKNEIFYPLTLLSYASKVFLEVIPFQQDMAFYKTWDLGSRLKTNIYYQSLTTFLKNHYMQWLTEMQKNNRAFRPFNLEGDFNSLVVDKPIKTGLFRPGIDSGYLKTQFGIIENKLQKEINREDDRRFMVFLNQIARKCYEKLESLPSMA